MEVLGLPVSPLISTPFSYNHNSHCNNHRLGKTQCFTSSSLIYKPFHQIQYKSGYRGIIRAQAVDEDYELKQVKDMAAARKRWESLVREGKVSVLTPREAGYAIQLSGKTLLDAWVKGSTWVPIFDVDTTIDAGTLSRKPIHTESYREIPERYRPYRCMPKGITDLERGGPQPFKFAGIGGLSEFLGWTDQQRAQAAKEEKVCYQILVSSHCKHNSRANPPSGSEWYQLEVMPFEIDTRTQEPLWAKLLRFVPKFRVPTDCPYIRHNRRSLGDIVPHDSDVFRGDVWNE
ncbi:hypothetical protein Ccrd_023615 [Cynara cardunculus var. scolymus]|uniref:Uncharacterized protein n=1 Tax=Cynara cardunculus var. scolymus TaxID=59895 RepID=A0A103XWI6_CYNCS|nr:hypothetical protein Ccrd_023615 [Cynara cardunculus var. scolymus]